MLQQDKADDYVVATGEIIRCENFLTRCFGYLDLDWQKYVEIDSEVFRPSEVDILHG